MDSRSGENDKTLQWKMLAVFKERSTGILVLVEIWAPV